MSYPVTEFYSLRIEFLIKPNIISFSYFASRQLGRKYTLPTYAMRILRIFIRAWELYL